MAITQTPRFGLTRWGADGDPQDRADFVKIVDALETAAKAAQVGMRNRIINGDFRVNQRGYVSGAALASGAFGFDRWKSTTAATTLTYAAAPAGQPVTVNAAGSIAQVIERANMPAGRYVLSHAGTAVARVYNAGAGGPGWRAAPFVVDLDGTADVVVEFYGGGAAPSTIDRVQLEQVGAGDDADDVTPFERRPLGLEFELCQRYFYRWSSASTPDGIVGPLWCYSATGGQVFFPFLTRMRAVPTVAFSAPGAFAVYGGTGGGAALTSALASVSTTEHSAAFNLAVAGGLTIGQIYMVRASSTTAAFIDLSAEL